MTLPLAVIALAIPFGLVVDDLPMAVRFAPFVVSVGLFGLPHGAVDHLVPLRLGDVALGRSLAVVSVVYAVLGGLYLAVWAISPAVALLAFLGMTWFHWGQGDAFALGAFGDGGHIRTRSDRWAALLVRGGLPMLVPLLGQPAGYRRVVNAIVELFDPAATAALAPLFQLETRLALGVGFAIFTLGSLLWTARHVWRGDTSVVGLGWDVIESGCCGPFSGSCHRCLRSGSTSRSGMRCDTSVGWRSSTRPRGMRSMPASGRPRWGGSTGMPRR